MSPVLSVLYLTLIMRRFHTSDIGHKVDFFFFFFQQFITRCLIAVHGKPYKRSTAYGYIHVRLEGKLPP
jgi:hypothetical protein